MPLDQKVRSKNVAQRAAQSTYIHTGGCQNELTRIQVQDPYLYCPKYTILPIYQLIPHQLVLDLINLFVKLINLYFPPPVLPYSKMQEVVDR